MSCKQQDFKIFKQIMVAFSSFNVRVKNILNLIYKSGICKYNSLLTESQFFLIK